MKRLNLIACLLACALNGASEGRRIEALPDSLWSKSEWIAAENAPVVHGRIGVRAADGASWFMSTVKNNKKLRSAKWMTTGLGTYTLYVNGRKIGDEILKPGFTHPFKTKRSFTYDVTDAFSCKRGSENVLAVQSVPGWWADKIVTPGGNDGMYGWKPAFRGVLELTYTDGSKEYHATGAEGWTAGVAGPVTHAGIFDGEEYDARVPQGFELAELLRPAEISTEFRGEILPSDGAEVYFRDDLALTPQEAYIWSGVSGATSDAHGKVNILRRYAPCETMTLAPGENLVIDFGQNSAAVPEFEFRAPQGTILTCLPSEILNDGNGAHSRGMDGPEGSVHRRNLRIGDDGVRLKYTFGDSGDSYAKFRPESTFFGYRFVSLSADGPVEIKAVKSIPVTSIAHDLERGSISTGNEDVNKLISNTVWGMRSNYLSVPTDCPQRDERLGWTADAQVFSETGTFFANTAPFFHKWMRDMRDSQSERGGFPGVAPLAQYGGEMTRLGWSDAGVIVPWTVWKQFGDTAIVNQSWDSMTRYVDYIGAVGYDHASLRGDNGDYQWADWLSYEPLESCSGRKDYQDADGHWHVRPEAYDYWNYLSANYLLIDALMLCDMGRATGRDVSAYERLATKTFYDIRDKHLNPDGTFKTEILNTMQTPALFALKNNLVEGSAREDMIARLRRNFEEHDTCLQTGFLGTSILMQTLTDNGMSDVAYDLLFQRKNPSWLYSIDNGATTIWERWNSYTLDGGMGPAGMNSFNHYAYGCVCEWLWETAAGIAADPAAPGFSRIIMKPVPDPRLGHLDAELLTPRGPVKSSWKYTADGWIWTFSIPEGSTALVTPPGSDSSRLYAPGTYTLTLDR